MAGTDLGLSGGMRNTLLTLQSLQAKIGTSQERLASGQRVNAMVNAPATFFAARNLNNRANDMMSLKDAMGQAISTVRAGSKGADTIQSLLAQARGLTTAAMGAMGNDATSLTTRKNLAERFDDILDAINGVVDDSTYRGKNLIKGDGKRIDATPESKLDVLKIPGIADARATNVKEEDTYHIDVLGTGAITGDPKNVADAEQARGIQPIIITGKQSNTQGNFNRITVEVIGAPGRDKQITVGNPPDTTTVKFTQDQWQAAKASGQKLSFDHTFNSGTRTTFNVDFDQIEAAQPNHGQGLSNIEKKIDLQVKVTDSHDRSITRDVNASLGNARLSDGENAFEFPTGTVRLSIDEKTLSKSILQKSQQEAWSEHLQWLTSTGSTSNYSNWMQWHAETQLNVNYDIFGGVPTQIDFLNDGTVIGSTGGPMTGAGTFTASIPKPNPEWQVSWFEIRYTPENGAAQNLKVDRLVRNESPETSTKKNELITRLSNAPGTSDDLTVYFDTLKSSSIAIKSQNMQVSGQGLQVDYSQNEWRDLADVESAVKGLDTAEQRLRNGSQALSNSLNIITTRETFTREFSDVLSEGATKLTLLDQNEEGSNLLLLQTRQQLSTTALSLAAKSQQSILNLF